MNPKSQTDLAATTQSAALCVIIFFNRATEMSSLCPFSPLDQTREMEELVASGVFSTQLNALGMKPAAGTLGRSSSSGNPMCMGTGFPQKEGGKKSLLVVARLSWGNFWSPRCRRSHREGPTGGRWQKINPRTCWLGRSLALS